MRLAKEHDVVPEGSLTRLATETYVDEHSSPPPPPDPGLLFVDDFSTDTIGAYTHVKGAANQYAVSGGKLTVVTQAPTEKIIVPPIPARKIFGIKAKFNQGTSGANGLWLAKVIDANNYHMLGIYNASTPDANYARIGGSMGFGPTNLFTVGSVPAVTGEYWMVAEFPNPVGVCTMSIWDADPDDPATTKANRKFALVCPQAGITDDTIDGYAGLNIEPNGNTSITIDDIKVFVPTPSK